MRPYRNNRIWTGFFLIVAGATLLAYKMGAPVPGWLFTWPVLLIVIGLLIGIKHGFRTSGWIIMVAIGSIFLIDRQVPGIHFHQYIIPVVIIMVGLFFVFRPRCKWDREHDHWRRKWEAEMNKDWCTFPTPETETKDALPNSEYIDSVSVFGGVKKVIFSKNFKGGEITCFMGGAEIDLSQADIQGTAVLDITQVFGGTKLIVPPHWNIKSEVAAVFGGIEDKRPSIANNPNPDKVLVLKGTSVFGGIDIKSY